MTDGPQRRSVAARWRELRAEEAAGRRVLLVASYTVNPLEAHVGTGLADADGARPDVLLADYNQVFQVCLDPVAHGADRVDEIVLLWRIEDVFERDFHAWANLDDGAADRLLEGARSLARAVAGLATAVAATVTAADAPTPVGFGLDQADPEQVHDLMALTAAVNTAFDDTLAGAPVERLRVAALQHAVGTVAAFDRRTWLMYRQPHTDAFTRQLGAAVFEALTGRTRVPPKVVVLDADDTLWSGIAANDGVGALQCSDAFPGIAHREFQRAVQRLRHRGVLLAVASKNDHETVQRAFAEVDGMVLTDDDIAGWKVSWGPKAPAIAELANEFNLGIDSFVFVDDSDHELGAINSQLPDVVTLRVPDDLEALPDLLSESGLFRGMRVTSDDRVRTARMLAESGRSQAATAMSHEDFLASLGLRVVLTEVGERDLGRVTQLVNKTNQFNLTSIRRGEAAVRALAARDDAAVFAVTVDDRFGEYGLVGVVIAVGAEAGGWELDTVLMSCRVLGRGVETAMLSGTVAELRARRPGPVTGRYVPTDRNALVAELLPTHGFTPTGEPGTFTLAAGAPLDPPGHLTLVRPGA